MRQHIDESDFEALKEKRVFVTGSSGYVGGELVRHLHANGISVFGADRLADASECLDLCDADATRAVLEEFRPDLLIHLGTHSALAYQNTFLDAFRDDSQSIVNLLSYLEGSPDSRLVFFASSYVYSGLDTAQRWDESAALNSNHNFGVAKSFFEQLLLRVHPSTVIFRLSSVFGPGNALHPNAIANMAQECMQDGELTIWGRGTRKMQYVFIDDVLKYILRSAQLASGIYNLGGHEYETVAQTANAIAMHFDSKAVFLEDKTEGQTLPFMENKKLIAEVGQDFFTPFLTALPNYLDTLKKQ